MTFSAAAFGRRMTWEDNEPHPGHRLSLKESIEAMDDVIFIKMLCPKWMIEWAPIKKIRKARDDFAEFQVCSPRTRPCTDILQLSFNSTYAVIFNRDD